MGIIKKSKYRNGETKVCPRCSEKCLIGNVKCQNCGLIFARLQHVSNKEGKKALRAGEKERVIYITQMTYDVSKIWAIVLCVFFGAFGVHNFYLGRYKRGVYISLCMLFSMFLLILNESVFYGTWWYLTIFYLFSPFGASVLFFWALDTYRLIFEKYKIPVALPQENYDEIKKGLELDKIEEDLETLKVSLREEGEEGKPTADKLSKKRQTNKNKTKNDKKVLNFPKLEQKEEETKTESQTTKSENVEEISENNEKTFENTEVSTKNIEERKNGEVVKEKKIVSIKNKKYVSYNNTKNKKSKK